MTYFKKISISDMSVNKFIPAVILVALLGIVVITIGRKPLALPGKSASRAQGPLELIDRLTKSIESVRGKQQKDVSNLAIAEAEEFISKDEVFLSGIVWSGEENLVLVNNEVFGTGDEVGGLEIAEIRAESVIFKDKHGKKRIVYLHENE